MKTDTKIPATMLAPCGITCAVCYAHLRKKKPCLGCRGQDTSKPEHCRKCKIKSCVTSQGIDFCFECPTFPCAIIKRLDKSYRQRYQVSLIENGVCAKTVGVEQHLLEEKAKWTCGQCGGVISLHDHACSECGKELA
jgi:hypothetical protein